MFGESTTITSTTSLRLRLVRPGPDRGLPADLPEHPDLHLRLPSRGRLLHAGHIEDPKSHTTTYQVSYPGQVTKATDALSHSRSVDLHQQRRRATSVDAIGVGQHHHLRLRRPEQPGQRQHPDRRDDEPYYANGTNCSTTDTTHPYLPKCV